jgi:hypothetical protein
MAAEFVNLLSLKNELELILIIPIILGVACAFILVCELIECGTNVLNNYVY